MKKKLFVHFTFKKFEHQQIEFLLQFFFLGGKKSNYNKKVSGFFSPKECTNFLDISKVQY